MITTVTLNASVDKACLVDAIRLGQPHRMKECHVTAGGKGLNVARVARRLGQEATATGYVGGFAGMMVESLLHADGIGCRFVPVAGESRTCVNIIDESTGYRVPGARRPSFAGGSRQAALHLCRPFTWQPNGLPVRRRAPRRARRLL